MKRLVAVLLLGCLAGGAVAQLRLPGSKAAPSGEAAPAMPAPGVQEVPAKPAPAHGPQLIDRIVAVVNSEVITQRDLAERIMLVETQLKRQGTAAPTRDVLGRQVLERMIMDRVQIQFARDTGVRVDDLQVDRTVQMIADNNKLTLAAFRRTLEREGVSFDRFREDIRNEILISRLREREVDSKIQVGDSDVDNFLQEMQAGDAGAQFDLSHILIRVPENASPDQIDVRLKRAQEALAKARAGADFAQLAVSYSDAPDALKGGGMGWRERDRLPELFVDALAKLKPGEVSDVIRSPAGFHIIRLNDRRGGGGSFMVEQTRVRHILARVNDLVSEDEARRKITVLRQRLVDGANFADLARLNSDDAASARRGGELPWTVPGDLVPEFERAMNALKIGELSQPVRTPFGFHIIQVLERRTADLSADRKRIEARRVLRERRGDEAYQEWLRQLRDRAYVEVRLEEQ
jgi:peptidyl-prolyl cis-trans isomerase SurA